MFYIKKLILSGRAVERSEIEFCRGLNIVYGPSNTGKSYIVSCLDYMFGADSIRIGEQTGYDTIELISSVSVTQGEVWFDIYMTRHIGSKDFEVVCDNVDFADSGIYRYSWDGPNLSNLWLKMIGIEKPVRVYKNVSYDTWALTLRILLQSFFITEDRVIKPESILLPEQNTGKTASKMGLLFLANGEEQGEEEGKFEKKEVAETKRDAVVEYIETHLDKINKKRDTMKKETESSEKIKMSMEDVLREIEFAEGEVSKAVERSKVLAEEIIALNKKLSQGKVVQNRYEVLLSQYESDIKRLTFIVEGDIHREDMPRLARCPFCNGELEKKEEENCVDAAAAELKKLIPQINDLKGAISDLEFEMADDEIALSEKEAERRQVEEEIKKVLEPKVARLRENLGKYSESVKYEAEAQAIEDIQKEVRTDLYEKLGEEFTDHKFSIMDEYGDAFVKDLSDIIIEVLTACAFDDGADKAYFDPRYFDIGVGRQPKKSYGKGYAAFLNTVLAISFQEYLDKYGTYKPGLLVVDSPILSLAEKREGDNRPISGGMKTSLFQYMVDHRMDRQSIIIENNIPEIDYNKEEVKLIPFTKTDEGRYGLLKTMP